MFVIIIIFRVAISSCICQCFIRIFMAQKNGNFLFEGKPVYESLFHSSYWESIKNFQKLLEVYVLKILMHTHTKKNK